MLVEVAGVAEAECARLPYALSRAAASQLSAPSIGRILSGYPHVRLLSGALYSLVSRATFCGNEVGGTSKSVRALARINTYQATSGRNVPAT